MQGTGPSWRRSFASPQPPCPSPRRQPYLEDSGVPKLRRPGQQQLTRDLGPPRQRGERVVHDQRQIGTASLPQSYVHLCGCPPLSVIRRASCALGGLSLFSVSGDCCNLLLDLQVRSLRPRCLGTVCIWLKTLADTAPAVFTLHNEYPAFSVASNRDDKYSAPERTGRLDDSQTHASLDTMCICNIAVGFQSQHGDFLL